MADYYIKITDAGLAALAAAEISSNPVVISQFAVGDANGISYNPTGSETALHHEVWRAAPNRVYIHPLHPTWIVVEAYIPPTQGGFDIRESGIFSAGGTLIAIGKYPLTNKPVPGSGSEKELYVRMIFQVTNATTVQQTIDTNLIFATHQYVDDLLAAHNTAATETAVGHVQLATAAEALAGLLNSKAVHPAGLKAAVSAAVTALLNGTPGALDTLKELADALGDDPNFATTVVNALALKAPLASPSFTNIPTAPTAANGANTLQLANTAFVQAALGGVAVQYVAASQGVNKGSYLVNTSAGPITLTLPLGPNLGDSLEFVDVAGTWSPNNLTINRNGQTIMGVADNLVCNVPGETFRLWFNGTTWRLN